MLEGDSPAKTFLGIGFLLLGFDPRQHHQIQSKLVDCGGVDVGHYSPNCTHVIVDKIVYDDPICVAARNDAKTLVTSLWVYHSFDVGVPVDATSIIYRPLKDLNGIPAAKRLIVCLTGYQRQDREDIMTMVGLMGAQFSKPLVANKVTHLICYKFEGEKYELAKKFQNIKLVNHIWLENCLREWAVLPENDYNKSGYEMEMMEAEARDSEDEAENAFVMQSGVRSICRSPHNIKAGSPATSRLPKLEGEVPKSPMSFNNAMDNLSSPQSENKLIQASSFSNLYGPKGLSGQAACKYGDSVDGKPNDQHHGTPVAIRRSDLASNSGSAEKPADSAGKLSCSLQTSWKSSPRLYVGDQCSHGSGSSKVLICKSTVNEDFATSAMKADQANDKVGTTAGEPLLKGTHLQNGQESSGMLPQKRIMDLSSYASTKSQKMSYDGRLSIMSSPSSHKSTKVIDGLCQIDSHDFTRSNEHFPDKTGKLSILENATAGVSPTKSSNFVQNPLACDPPFSPTLISETAQDGNISNKTPLTTLHRIRKSSLSSKSGTVDCVVEKFTAEVGETTELQNQHQDGGGLSPNRKSSVTENSNNAADLNLLNGGNSDPVTEPLRKKMMAKKTLGSRPNLIFSNSKVSGHMNEDASLNSSRLYEKSPSSITVEAFSPEVNLEAPEELEDKNVTRSAGIGDNKIESMDDETEAPEEDDERKLENKLHEARPIGVQLNSKVRTFMEENSEQVQHILDDSDACVHGDATASVDNTKGDEQEKVVSDKIPVLVESTSKGKGVKGKKSKGKKRPLGKTELETVPAVTELMKPKKVVSEDDTNESGGESEEEYEKGQPKHSSAHKKKLESTSKLKENRPIICVDQNVREAEPRAVKSMVNCHITALKKNQASPKITPKPSPPPDGEGPSKVRTQPSCFILSGHRFQRKDFQQVIRRLKGRCCRDSHHWSYQATHFIVPDPIRRTEKFFAAAASGRWILKSDYLAASNQAGRLLAEEPHEWYKNGLSEDGAINLEAPRKWRLLRERTGHGAFYGMRIVIYGECIAPTLDTIKRAVKAGDGTILATSPPYTRFLNWGVDFAIVSPGMPHADMWVQEFLKHEIPCVVADYLVEYVCKPGYPLDRHVLYNTHARAEKSFGSLQSRAEEIVDEDLTPTDDDSGNTDDDIPCTVCGSGERGEVMLICGNESGSVGCGVGTHIDCCNPPLEDVPEDDWFCPKCSRTEMGRNPPKKRKKGKSK